MYVYLLQDNNGNTNGIYTELGHAYIRMIKVWVELNCIDDEAYYEKAHHTDKLENDWNLYKVPVGEFENVYIQSKAREGSQYYIEIPETYGDLRCEIRKYKIGELVE